MAKKTVRFAALNFARSSFARSLFARALFRGSLAAIASLTLHSSVFAQVAREDFPQIANLPDIPVSKWEDQNNLSTGVKPKGVAVAIHGLIMHGRVYDQMARDLAQDGYVVFAPDLRGYGRWNSEDLTIREGKDPLPENHKVNYEQSFQDLKALVSSIKSHYGDTPVYLIGESLGAGFSMRLASELPNEIAGIVLSSPALKRRFYLEPVMVKQVARLMTNPAGEIDLVPYIKKFSSEDPMIVQDTIEDPYVRKRLNCAALCATARLIKSNMSHVEGIPADMPVLVLQGDNDRMLKAEAVSVFMDKLRSKDQTIRWMPGKGHVLIETNRISPDTLGTIKDWLASHNNTNGNAKLADNSQLALQK